MLTRRIVLLLPVLALSLAAQQPTPRELFERARILEESNRGLDEAVGLYGQVVSRSTDRQLAATAQLRIGLLYERLGRAADAQRVFRTVSEQYADQGTVARQAQMKLDVDAAAGDAAPRSRQVWRGTDASPLVTPSPSGQSLAYVDLESGNLAIRGVTNAASRPLTADASYIDRDTRFAEFSVFSADSRQLAYGWYTAAAGYELRTIGADGSNGRTVYRSADVSFIRPFGWTPDARRILVTLSDNDGSTRLAFIDAVSGSVSTIKTIDWRAPVRASLSPDGSWIAYDFPPVADKPERDIYVLAADGRREMRVVEHPSNDLAPMWTPDGRFITFLTDRGGSMAAWIQTVTNGKAAGTARLLKADMTRTFPLGFTGRGSFYYVVQARQEDIYVAALDDQGRIEGQPSRVSEHLVGANESPDWSPDGMRLAYVSKRLPRPMAQWIGGRMLCILDRRSGEVRELWPALAYLGRPRWSPDGRELLVTARVNGRAGLYRVDVERGTFSRLMQLERPGSFSSLEWSRDGKAAFLVAATGMGDGQQVIRVDLATAREVVIDGSPGSKSDLAVSHDGVYLAYRATKTGTSGQRTATIRVTLTGGGPSRDLLSEGVSPAGFRGINWTAGDRHLMFAVADRGAFRLARVAPAGGPVEMIGDVASGRLFDVRLHPDGRSIAFTSGEGEEEIWVMDNVLPSAGVAGAGR